MKHSAKVPVVIITGCSSGIGLATARLLTQTKKHKVVVTMRKKSLDKFKNDFNDSDYCLLRPLDITNDLEIQSLVSEVYKKWRSIDIVVNNAGISYRSVIEHMDEDSEIHQLKTNYLGPMSLIRLVLPSMREQGHGKIINVSSVSGMLSMPTMGSYSASKSALDSASESLWYEMKPFGVHVSIVQPGFVNSQSFRNVYYSKKAKISENILGPYAMYYSSIAPFVEKMMGLSRTTPIDISKKIYQVMQSNNPPLWIPATYDAHFFNFLRRLLPSKLFYSLLYKFTPGSKLSVNDLAPAFD